MSLRTKEAELQFPALGILMILGYLGFYILWSKVNVQQYENLDLRIIACFIGLSLLLKKYWPKKLKALLPLYWYVSLTYAFPFFFTFMLLKNNGSPIWQVNTMLGLILLVILTDWLSSIVLVIIGSASAWIAYVLTTSHPEIPQSVINGVLFDYIGVIIFGGLFIHNKARFQQEKISTLISFSFGDMIAHEMRTPLASINLIGSILKQWINPLIETYRIAAQHKLDIPYISTKIQEQLPSNIAFIEMEVGQAQQIINMLLTNVGRNKIEGSMLTRRHIINSINEALDSYVFDFSDKKLIVLDSNTDFEFMGNDFFINILFNLIKNSLYQIKASNRGKVYIWAELGKEFNRLHFKDTARGLSKEKLAQLFKPFSSDTKHGTGLGLAHCMVVMESYGGQISCKSKEGEFAEFILEFPVIKT